MSETIRVLESIKIAASNRLTGITTGLLDSEMRWVLSDFLAETRVWKKAFTITCVPGTKDYAIPMEDYESGVMLTGATYNGFPICPQLDERAYSDAGMPAYAGLLDDRTLRIYPVPDASQTAAFEVVVALTMLPTVEVEPPTVVRPFHEALLCGLLARCFGMGDRPWGNLRLAPTMNAEYDAAKMKVRRLVDTGRTRTATFAKFPPI